MNHGRERVVGYHAVRDHRRLREPGGSAGAEQTQDVFTTRAFARRKPRWAIEARLRHDRFKRLCAIVRSRHLSSPQVAAQLSLIHI